MKHRLPAVLVLLAGALAPVAGPAQPASAAGAVRVDPLGVLGANRPQTVALSASGLDAGARYDLTFDATYLASPTADGNGRVDIRALDLPGAACGDHDIVLTSRGIPVPGFAAAAPGDASATYRVLCPTISLSPATTTRAGLAAGVTVLPNGDFDLAGDDIPKPLLLDGVQVQAVRYHQPVTLAQDAACGRHTVTLVQRSSFGTLVASAPLTVLCPTVTLAPAAVARGGGYTVHGSAFDPQEPVVVTVDGVTVAGPPVGVPPVTDGLGAVSVPLRAAPACGQHTVTVTELRPVPPPSAAATLTVRCPSRSPSVTLDPDVVAAGMTTHVTGSGFRPGAPVTLRWQLPDGSVTTVDGGPVTADAAGRIDLLAVVLAHDPTGARVLVAADPVASATAPAVVEGGTMQPSGGSGQIVFRR